MITAVCGITVFTGCEGIDYRVRGVDSNYCSVWCSINCSEGIDYRVRTNYTAVLPKFRICPSLKIICS